MGIVRDLYYARKMSAGLKLPAPTVALLIKRLALASMMGAPGTLISVTGNAPIVLTNAIEAAMKSLIQYGLCAQASTPTPSDPVDIKCNNGTLKWDSENQRIYADGTPEVLTVGGTNLLNTATNITGKYISGGGSITNADDAQYTDLIPVNEGELYVASFVSGRDYGTNYLHGYNANGGWVKRLALVSASGQQGAKLVMSAMIDSGISYVRLSYGLTDTEAIISQEPIPSNEFYVGRIGSGTKAYINSLESTITSPYSASAYHGFGIVTPVVPESAYALTWSGTGFGTYGIGFYASIDDVTDVSKCISGGNIKGLSTFVVPSGANYAVLVFANSSSTTLTLDYWYVNPAPTYAPYVVPQTATAENLLSVGTVKDEQDIISGAVTRKCGVCYYDGTQAIGDVYISTTGGKDNGAIIVYPLATPVTEQVTAQHLTTNEGTNTVSVTAEVSPVELKAEYKASA